MMRIHMQPINSAHSLGVVRQIDIVWIYGADLFHLIVDNYDFQVNNKNY